MAVYKVAEDGGSFKLPGLDELSDNWMPEVKTSAAMYPEGKNRNVRCLFDTRLGP